MSFKKSLSELSRYEIINIHVLDCGSASELNSSFHYCNNILKSLNMEPVTPYEWMIEVENSLTK